MDWFRFPYRFVTILLLASTAALAGCSGSSGASSVGDGQQPPADDGRNPPVDQPPADDPGQTPPDDTPDDTPPDDDPDDSQPDPVVSLNASESVVPSGDSVVLTWSSSNATSCAASGGWSGDRPVQGSAQVGPLSASTTFSLTCSGAGGNGLAMLSVSVLGVVSLEWEPPTENVDGTALDDLDGYRIYYGTFSRNYTEELAVDDQARTDFEVTLPSGSYYFAMTALDAEGNESGYSNEVIKTIN